jgi:hypothetical protein
VAKGYVSRWKRREREKETHIMDFWFASRAENAAVWDSEMEAQNDCVLFNRMEISISVAGGAHPCGNFKVEKRTEGEFVVFCDAPFHQGSD